MVVRAETRKHDKTAPAADSPDSLAFQRTLKEHYLAFFRPASSVGPAENDVASIRNIYQMEDTWCRQEDELIDPACIPKSADEFDHWYLQQIQEVQQSDSVLLDYLKESATVEALAHYILADTQFSSGFDDVMALAQTSLPLRCKMAIAKNYWDEIGNGDENDAHTEIFDQCYDYFGQVAEQSDHPLMGEAPVETVKKGNIFYAWLRRPKYKPRLLGAVGVDECSAVNRWKGLLITFSRHNIPDYAREYQKVHVEVDARHGKDWIENVLHPYVRINDDYLHETSIGVLTLKRLKQKSNEKMQAIIQGITQAGRHENGAA